MYLSFYKTLIKSRSFLRKSTYMMPDARILARSILRECLLNHLHITRTHSHLKCSRECVMCVLAKRSILRECLLNHLHITRTHSHLKCSRDCLMCVLAKRSILRECLLNHLHITRTHSHLKCSRDCLMCVLAKSECGERKFAIRSEYRYAHCASVYMSCIQYLRVSHALGIHASKRASNRAHYKSVPKAR